MSPVQWTIYSASAADMTCRRQETRRHCDSNLDKENIRGIISTRVGTTTKAFRWQRQYHGALHCPKNKTKKEQIMPGIRCFRNDSHRACAAAPSVIARGTRDHLASLAWMESLS